MKKVAIGIEINNNAGRGVLCGILRFVSGPGQWKIRLMNYPETMTAATVESLEREGYDGIIINHVGDEKTARALQETKLPLSTIDLHDPCICKRRHRIAFCENDNLKVGALAAQKFLALGRFSSYAFVGHPDRPNWSEERKTGFCRELKSHRKTVSTCYPCVGADSQDLSSFLRQLPKSTAIMVAWDFKAVDVLNAIREIGLKVPDDAAVIGVDADPLLCAFTDPPLTSIAPDFEQLGYQAAAALNTLMHGHEHRSVIRMCCPPKGLIERDSTRFLPPALSLIERAKEIIQQDAATDLSVRDIATRLGVSQSLLALRFRQIEHRSVRDYLLTSRLKSVQNALVHSKSSIASIAKNCGFHSNARLSILFKSRFGVSMREYRIKNVSPAK